MYDESGYFDPPHDSNPMGGSLLDGPPAETCSSNNNNNRSSLDDNHRLHVFSLEELSNQQMNAASMGLDHLLHQLGFDLEQDFHGHLMQEAVATVDTWNNPNLQDTHEGSSHHPNLHLPPYGGAGAASDLLNLLHLPASCTVSPPVLQPAHALSFNSPGRRSGNFPMDIFGGGELPVSDGGSAALYDASVQLGYPGPPGHLLRDIFHSLPQNYGLFYGVDEREVAAAAAAAAADVGAGMVEGGVVFREGEGGQFEDAMFEFRRVSREEGKVPTTEKQRREQLGEKFKLLKSLVPNPTKNDRASTISDAIDYINELKRTIEELTILVDTKRYGRNKKRKREDEAAAADMESSSMKPLRDDADHPFVGALRSSWVQRRSKETFVDVRVVDDEICIKVTRRKKANCLLSASKAIEELQLDLIHASGGHIGDCHIFLFNTKIPEGSCVYASAVAKKLLEVMDRPSPTFPICL